MMLGPQAFPPARVSRNPLGYIRGGQARTPAVPARTFRLHSTPIFCKSFLDGHV